MEKIASLNSEDVVLENTSLAFCFNAHLLFFGCFFARLISYAVEGKSSKPLTAFFLGIVVIHNDLTILETCSSAI